ncbi:MAG: hypothetical protein NBV63_02150 [Candidatus Pacebacteria bacterium]|nr:hypothetical protein [Candidatus Paceibacterota bacterium]
MGVETVPGNTPAVYRNVALLLAAYAFITLFAVVLDAGGDGSFLDDKGRAFAGYSGGAALVGALLVFFCGVANTPEVRR